MSIYRGCLAIVLLGLPLLVAAGADTGLLESVKKGDHARLQSLLADKSIDVVFITTPEHLHYEMTIAALRAGKHVLVEKPMAMNANEAQAMVRAAEKARRLLQIGLGRSERRHRRRELKRQGG